MASKNVPMIPVSLGAAATLELGAGTALLLGYRHRAAAALLAAFLVPTSLVFHDFWNEEDAQGRQMQIVNFLKNLAIIGGLVGMAARGAEEFSLDSRRKEARVEGAGDPKATAGESTAPDKPLQRAAG